jgi:peroxiredoxin/DNA-binding beta-propeller fold protein YncE
MLEVNHFRRPGQRFVSVMGMICLALFLGVTSVRADDGGMHTVRFFTPALTERSEIPTALGRHTEPTIVVRYLGYRCSHCVEHLLYINTYAAKLRERGIRVIATSPDNVVQWQEMAKQFDLDTALMSYISDPENTLAAGLGALPRSNDTVYDAHAVLVLRDGRVALSVVSDQPYMDIERLVGHAVPPAAMVPEDAHSIDQYLTSPIAITSIATATDGIASPIDLDFSRSPLQGNDLWVVTAEPKGHAISIIHNAGTPQQVIRKKKDSRANHFMWRTMGIAMGTNGAFATAQNGEPGNNDLNYMFMGPTLWSADTAVFASRYQEDDTKLASHLDMLHQSPWGLGIAHDTANVYWVLDARYKDICRYDFRDPHEVGGTDHRDGIIRRYSDVTITPAERGRPSHIDLDPSTGFLYYIDPGKGSVHVLDTRTGRVDQQLTPPRESSENLAEFVSMTDAVTRMVIKPGVISEPVGIDVYGNRLLVGDRATGKIHVFALSDTIATLKGAISTGATALHGITVGPDGRIWFVDNALGTVRRLDVSSALMLSTPQRVRAINRRDTIRVTVTNGTWVKENLRLRYRFTRHDDGTQTSWTNTPVLPPLVAGALQDVEIPVLINDSLSVWTCDVSIVKADGSVERSLSITLVPRNVRKAVVNDELNGTFDIVDAVRQTDRRGYVAIPSDVFTLVANDLPVLKTVLWNAGSFGELSDVDDAVVRSLLTRQIEVLLIGDDPLLLRTDLPGSTAFFRSFGSSLRGADAVENDNGQRVLRGVLADPVTAGMSQIDVQLPRLDHHRGGKYVPNVKFLIVTPARGMITRADTVVCAVRNETPTYRSIILGVNASRFLDGQQRTQILDKGLAWLEEFANADTIDNPTSVETDTRTVDQGIDVRVGSNPVVTGTTWSVRSTSDAVVSVALYTAAGQRVANLYEGIISQAQGTLNVDHLPAGAYFLVGRTTDHVDHCTIIIR